MSESTKISYNLYHLYYKGSYLVVSSKNNKLDKINKDLLDYYNKNNINYYQKTIFIEIHHNNGYILLNPFTGLLINTSDLTTTNNKESCKFEWIKNTHNWVINHNNNLSVDDIKENIRVIWNDKSLELLGLNINNPDKQSKIDKMLILKEEQSKIDLLKSNSDYKPKLIITAGSQAAGKSSFIRSDPVKYKDYYELDSDEYIGKFQYFRTINNFTLNYNNTKKYNIINSFKDASKYFTSICKDIEWELMNYCIKKNKNFIKQGTSLWLWNIADKANILAQYQIIVKFFWIDVNTMMSRLTHRLSQTDRYYYNPIDSIESYNKEWMACAEALFNKDYKLYDENGILNFFKIARFELISNDITIIPEGPKLLYSFQLSGLESTPIGSENYPEILIAIILKLLDGKDMITISKELKKIIKTHGLGLGTKSHKFTTFKKPYNTLYKLLTDMLPVKPIVVVHIDPPVPDEEVNSLLETVPSLGDQGDQGDGSPTDSVYVSDDRLGKGTRDEGDGRGEGTRDEGQSPEHLSPTIQPEEPGNQKLDFAETTDLNKIGGSAPNSYTKRKFVITLGPTGSGKGRILSQYSKFLNKSINDEEDYVHNVQLDDLVENDPLYYEAIEKLISNDNENSFENAFKKIKKALNIKNQISVKKATEILESIPKDDIQMNQPKGWII